ncbi:MAG: DUF2520 domain-containing protein [Bacteroidota bacterium]
MNHNICFIGAGNLATHLSKELQRNGYKISQVYSRSVASAKELGEKLNTSFTTSVAGIDSSADVFFVALKDSAVKEVLSQIDFQNKLVVHCSGSLPITVLDEYSDNIGVLYPLQTFSKNRDLDFHKIPVFVEANTKENEQILFEIAGKISETTSALDSGRRKSLHISAVFACNFVNHFYFIASQILKSDNISFDVLRPLILETAEKVQQLDPFSAQTGPAVRFDEKIINDHLSKLNEFPEYQELYNSISKSIFEHH